MKFTFLGTGASVGIPMIGCDCSVCKSKDPKNNRMRPSALLQINNKNILIDAGPDFRAQALKYGIKHIDLLVLTHSHYDHTAGLDDLRVFYFLDKKPIRCLLSEENLKELQQRYFYFFNPIDHVTTVDMKFDFHTFDEDFGEFDLDGINFSYFSYMQLQTIVYGIKINDFAYVTDIKSFSDELITFLKGTKTLVISAIEKKATRAHFGIDDAISFAREVGAEKTYLTHIDHDIDYEKISKTLPKDVKLAYDGLELKI
jgi:phosphoribosyl 1,2-cyclic phosphate phosphodiesterase